MAAEGLAALAMGIDEPGPGGDVLAGQVAELVQAVEEARAVGIGDVVGAIGGADAADIALGRHLLVMGQGIEREFGGRDGLDPEAIENGAGTQGGRRERRVDGVVDGVGRGAGQFLGNAEDGVERMIDPGLGRGAGEEMVVVGKEAPGLAAVALDGAAILAGDAQRIIADAAAAQHAEHVVVGREERAVGVENRPLSANQAGSVCPCGLTMGRSLTAG